MTNDAQFSPCGVWRYTLRRTWCEHKPAVAFIGLNPSTATATANDPTVTRCINFARNWCYGTYWMLNIFAFRSPFPKVMREYHDNGGDITGPENDEHITRVIGGVEKVVCCWGNHGVLLERGDAVLKLVEAAGHVPHCLGVNYGGQPKHPLYLSRVTEPVPMVDARKEREVRVC